MSLNLIFCGHTFKFGEWKMHKIAENFGEKYNIHSEVNLFMKYYFCGAIKGKL